MENSKENSNSLDLDILVSPSDPGQNLINQVRIPSYIVSTILTFFAVPAVCPEPRVRAVPPPDPGAHSAPAAPVDIHRGPGDDVFHNGCLVAVVGAAAIVVKGVNDLFVFVCTI